MFMKDAAYVSDTKCLQIFKDILTRATATSTVIRQLSTVLLPACSTSRGLVWNVKNNFMHLIYKITYSNSTTQSHCLFFCKKT